MAETAVPFQRRVTRQPADIQLSISPSARAKAKRKTPLTDLIESEKEYVDLLAGIIRKVASAWTRSNFPPPELDSVFRSVEAIFRANRSFFAKLEDIGHNPSSPKALGDLLISWIQDLETPYTRYSENLGTGFDIWEPVQSNNALTPLLQQLSTSIPPTKDACWTLDSLFDLPRLRLKYYKKLYTRLLNGNQLGSAGHAALARANEKLDVLIEAVQRRLTIRVGESILTRTTEGPSTSQLLNPSSVTSLSKPFPDQEQPTVRNLALVSSNAASSRLHASSRGDISSANKHEVTAPVATLQGPGALLDDDPENIGHDFQSLDLTNTNQTILDDSNTTFPVHDLSGYWEKLDGFAFSKGGNSDIYKARLLRGPHPYTEQLVAVKMLRSVRIRHGSLVDDILYKRFQREVQTWSRLDHRHVIPFLGFAFEGYFPCLVAPWYKNGDLSDFIQDYPDCDRTRFVNECMEGLVYLHSLDPSVIHGDLKASNILVDDDGKARLTDFGLSRFLQDGPTGFTTSSTPCGTPRWMAPELLNGNSSKPTTASDVYASVLLALEIYTQKQPFPDLDQWRFFMVIQKGQSPQRSHYTPFNPPEQVWQVFEKGWTLDPARRPTALDIKSMFLNALAVTSWENK